MTEFDKSSSILQEIALKFGSTETQEEAWSGYCSLETWQDRVQLESIIRNHHNANNIALSAFFQRYRRHMEPYFRNDFYDVLLDNNLLAGFAKKYAQEGEVEIRLLRDECLSGIAERSIALENVGCSRYSTSRSVYPPGEVKQMDEEDPRKTIMTGVNMVAVGAGRMAADDAVQWIYHSPHLQLFVQGVLRLSTIHPYQCDLGVAVNIMRPTDNAKNALGFHFDTIDSSTEGSLECVAGSKQSRGATGVIGIQDCESGGERVTFPSINRKKVDAVKAVVDRFDPLFPGAAIQEYHAPGDSHTPVVVREPISGMLSLFNGGDILHGVSSMRKGVRIATVFLYCEQEPSQCDSTIDSANAFYNNHPA